jgi:hypothetical protein
MYLTWIEFGTTHPVVTSYRIISHVRDNHENFIFHDYLTRPVNPKFTCFTTKAEVLTLSHPSDRYSDTTHALCAHVSYLCRWRKSDRWEKPDRIYKRVQRYSVFGIGDKE